MSETTDLRAFGRESIAAGSKSFALASLFFRERMQADAQKLYAWCRHCDDVTDGQTMGGDAPDGAMSVATRARLVEELREKTRNAWRGETTGEAAFDGVGVVARRTGLPERYAMHLIDGFALDVEPRIYETREALLAYCYGVAGVVGVMMAIIMGVEKDDAETLYRACDMGLAFQLTNICRDVIDDAKGGRLYLPADYLAREGVEASAEAMLDVRNREGVWRAACRLLDDADIYYASAREGVRRLPPRAAMAIVAARNIYREIGQQLRGRGPTAWEARIVAPQWKKYMLAFGGAVAGASASAFGGSLPARSANLWRRPA